jgi:hypothetical protein
VNEKALAHCGLLRQKQTIWTKLMQILKENGMDWHGKD